MRRSLRRAFVAYLGCAAMVLGSERPALGQGASRTGPSIAWDAPSRCPAIEDIRRAIDAMLAGSSRPRDDMDLVAHATVTEKPGGFRMRTELQILGGSESKTLDAESCDTLADAYAVIVAFTIDPGAAARAAPPVRKAAPVPPPVISAPHPESPGTPLRLAGGPFASSGVGLLPFPSLGLGGRLAIEAGLRFEIAAAYWLAESASVASTHGGTLDARVSLTALHPDVCLLLASRSLDVCLGAQIGSLHAEGRGVATPGSGSWWWVAPTASVGARLELTPALAVWARVDAGVMLYRRDFVFENVGTPSPVQAYEPAPVFATLTIEPELTLFSTEPGGGRHDSR